jgi:glycine/D-amino acid oxidase-like deaminating enzyme
VKQEVDVLIAGGGVMGSACAYFLKARLGFSGSVRVIEPDPSYRNAASSRSASSVRQQFSTPINIALSAYGMEFLRAARHAPEAGGIGTEVGLVESSYLFLATTAGAAVLERQAKIQREAGVAVRVRDRAALAARYPWLEVSDLAAGCDCEHGEGWFDGHALLEGLRAAAQAHGARFVRDRVLAFEPHGTTHLQARLEQAGEIRCAFAVLAAGTQARELARSAGVDLPVVARKRTVFVFTCAEAVAPCPLVIDPCGLWFRPDHDRFLCGLPSEPDPDVAADDFEVDLGEFERRYWPLLAQRVPAFEAIRLASAWAGHYDYNVFDQNAFLGPVPHLPQLLLATGFTGHGIQQAPAVGRALAELIHYGAYRSLDVSPLSYARYLEQRPLREFNVI